MSEPASQGFIEKALLKFRRIAGKARHPVDEPSTEPEQFYKSLTFYIRYKYFKRIITQYLFTAVTQMHADRVHLIFDEVEKDADYFKNFISILAPALNENDFSIEMENPAYRAMIERLIKKGIPLLKLKKIVKSNQVMLIEMAAPLREHYYDEAQEIIDTALWHATPEMFKALYQYDLLPPDKPSCRAKNLWTLLSRLLSPDHKENHTWEIIGNAYNSKLLAYEPTIAFQGVSLKLIERLESKRRLEDDLISMFDISSKQIRVDLLNEFIMNELPDAIEAKEKFDSLLPGLTFNPTPEQYREVLPGIIDSLSQADLSDLASELQSSLLKSLGTSSGATGRRKAVKL